MRKNTSFGFGLPLTNQFSANSYYVILDKVLWSHLTGDWSLFPALYLMFYTNVPILLSLLLVYRIPDILHSY